MDFVFEPPPPTTAATTDGRLWPVRRLLCLGRNYAEHVAELGNQLKTEDLPFFTKWAEAVVGPGAAIAYPPETSDWHFEVELVAAIGAGGAAIAEERALDHVWGYAVGVDMTRRDLQRRAKEGGAPWDWAKNGAATAPLGPIAPVAEVGHITMGAIRLFQNGALRQDGDVSEMIWSTARAIAYLSRFFPLAEGDLVFTGTPSGVGPAAPGDEIRAEIDGLPPLEFTIAR